MKICIFLLLLSLFHLTFSDNSEYNYLYGGSLDQPSQDFSIGFSGSVLQNKNQAKQDAGEIRISSYGSSSSIKAKAGFDYEQNKYGNIDVNLKSQLNSNAVFQAIGNGNYYNGKENGTANLTYSSSDRYSNLEIGTNMAIDDNSNKDYNAYLSADDRFSSNTEGKVNAFYHKDDLKTNAQLQSDFGGFLLTGVANGDISVSQQKLNDYSYGGKISTSIGDGTGDIGVGATVFKNSSKNGFGYIEYSSNFANGKINGEGNVQVDLNTNDVTSEQAYLQINQYLTDNIDVIGTASYLNGQTDLDGKAILSTDLSGIDLKASAEESYDYTNQKVKDRLFQVSLDKKLENGELKGNYNWENGHAQSHAEGSLTNYINAARLLLSGAIDYDYNSKAMNGTFDALIDKIKVAGLNFGAKTHFTTIFNNEYDGLVGAFVSDAYETTKASLTFNGNLRGGKKDITSTVATFDHQINPDTNLHLIGTKYPDGNFEVDGILFTVIGTAKANFYFKIDKDGNFMFSI